MEKKKRSAVRIIVAAVLAAAAVGLVVYPMVSYRLYAKRQAGAIQAYSEAVERCTAEDFAALRLAAREYNAALLGKEDPFLLSAEEEKRYVGLLNPDGTGIMGYVEIPAIGLMLPIYHGTAGTVLQEAAGHVPWSSLPVGGESTHCIIPGHRGLAASKLFTDLDDLQIGDKFYLHVLDEVLTYEVDRILVTEPEDPEPLKIVSGEDLCTLYTCTPFGINTQRLLVRGHRVSEG